MFDLPSRDDITKCVITKETVINNSVPTLLLEDGTVVAEEKSA
jgi:ATP-dependent Clp protease ATP-binding subunit ClpX